MKTNISLAGLSKEFKQQTVSCHPWNNPQKWALKPESGWAVEPDDWDSEWTLEPDEDRMIIATDCFITVSCAASIEESATEADDQSLIIEGHFYVGGPVIEIIRFPSLGKLIDRSLTKQVIVPVDVTATSSIQKAFYEMHIPFAEDVLLWSSAGVDTGQTPPALYTYDTLEGAMPKFSKMTSRIANNRPYEDGNSGDIELAYSRYFVHIFEDPGNE